jgi:hypothetical protein
LTLIKHENLVRLIDKEQMFSVDLSNVKIRMSKSQSMRKSFSCWNNF